MTRPDIVFLGPSLDATTARSLFPTASFYPPIQCGDILRVLRRRPRMIVIIDGLFERVAAVWHKEILLALRSGVTVIGGGSMGALRAAELAPLGMIGVGRSFVEYRDGVLVDDDDVAVIHTERGEALSDAMVNIRDAAEAAVAAGLLDAPGQTAVVAWAKQRHYAERSLEAALRGALDEECAARVSAWIRRQPPIDRKRADAIATLRTAADVAAQPEPWSDASGAPVVTGFLRGLARQLACATAGRIRPDHDVDERVACAARFLGPAFDELTRLALLLGAVHDIAGTLPYVPVSDAPLPSTVVDVADVDALTTRWRRVSGVCASLGVTDEDADAAVADLLRLDGRYRRLRAASDEPGEVSRRLAQTDASRFVRLQLTGRLWCAIDRLAAHASLVPRVADLQEYVDRFRYQRDLGSATSMRAWLHAHDLDESTLGDLLARAYRFENLILTANLGAFGVAPRVDGVWWLRDALWLTGAYQEAAELLHGRGMCQMPPDDATAYERDFPDGLRGAQIEHQAMTRRHLVAV